RASLSALRRVPPLSGDGAAPVAKARRRCDGGGMDTNAGHFETEFDETSRRAPADAGPDGEDVVEPARPHDRPRTQGSAAAEPDIYQRPIEDTLLDRGVDDILDEGYSPPER